MSTAQVQSRSRVRSSLVDYLAFTLLFASVSVAVAVALGGIVLLLTPSGESAGRIEGALSEAAQLQSGVVARQAGAQ